MIYSDRTRAALRFAVERHGRRLRKGTTYPYYLHPIAVATILAASEASEDLVCAGYLHDLVEDEDVPLATIEERYGANVARLVDAVTDVREAPDGARVPWRTRREQVIDDLAVAELDVLALKGADLCANVTDVVLDHATLGPEVWARFRAGREQQVWYYSEAGGVVLRRLTSFGRLRTDLTRRLAELRDLS